MDAGQERVERLYREYGPEILRYLEWRHGAAAEDLLQEVFLQALRHADALADVGQPRAWLYAVARNVGLNAQRRRRVEEAHRLQASASPADVAPPPDAQRLQSVRAAIAELPDLHREVLELRLNQDLAYEEIALTVGIPVGTVRSRLHHAIRAIRARVCVKESEP